MKKTLIGLLVLMMVSGFVALAQASPVNVTVRVTITSAVEITLVSGGLIVFPSMEPGVDAVIVSSSTVISNSGSGVNQTYKMRADSPGVWTAGGTAGHDTYVLQAAFNDTLPTVGGFDTLDNDLVEDTDKTASSTVLTIDGTYTGASVPYGEDRSIWYEFQPPSTSSLTGTQDITVTITAIEG